MPMPIRWIDAGRVSHIRSQSIYHGLGYAQTPETTNTVVMVIPEEPYLCIGYFQDATKEVNLSYCRDNSLPVIRRETGGGTVYIDSGQLFVQWICQPGFLPRKVEQRFQLFNKVMTETYKFFGIQAYHYPVNDVHVNGKKIVGTGAATIGNAEVVTGNFLYDFDIEIMTQALKTPNEEFRNALRNSLDNYMTWIKRELKHPPSYFEIIQTYKKRCEQILDTPIVDGNFTEDEMQAIILAEEKLQQNDWLHSIKSSPSRNKLVKIHAGVWIGWMVHEVEDFSIQVFSQMCHNAIEMIRFYLPISCKSDWDISQLEKDLINVPLVDGEIRDRIRSFFDKTNQSDTIISIDHWTMSVMQIKKEVQKVSGHA